MFERFTDKSRRVLVLAQEEARLLNHNFIGSEHILLGLIRQGDGVAAQALGALGIGLETVRLEVERNLGPAGTSLTGSPPFTPRAKKVLELSLREALQLGHNYIGTEHILLGLVREGEGVGAQVLVSLGADLSRVRQQVITLVAGSDVVGPQRESEVGPPLPARPSCGRCRARLSEFTRYARIEANPGDEAGDEEGPITLTVFYCGRCGTILGAPLETSALRPGLSTSPPGLSTSNVPLPPSPGPS
jgi:ATP-dependent Clp protease ATP-binding subunit ClpA